jgi:hypothetical protein
MKHIKLFVLFLVVMTKILGKCTESSFTFDQLKITKYVGDQEQHKFFSKVRLEYEEINYQLKGFHLHLTNIGVTDNPLITFHSEDPTPTTLNTETLPIDSKSIFIDNVTIFTCTKTDCVIAKQGYSFLLTLNANQEAPCIDVLNVFTKFIHHGNKDLAPQSGLESFSPVVEISNKKTKLNKIVFDEIEIKQDDTLIDKYSSPTIISNKFKKKENFYIYLGEQRMHTPPAKRMLHELKKSLYIKIENIENISLSLDGSHITLEFNIEINGILSTLILRSEYQPKTAQSSKYTISVSAKQGILEYAYTQEEDKLASSQSKVVKNAKRDGELTIPNREEVKDIYMNEQTIAKYEGITSTHSKELTISKSDGFKSKNNKKLIRSKSQDVGAKSGGLIRSKSEKSKVIENVRGEKTKFSKSLPNEVRDDDDIITQNMGKLKKSPSNKEKNKILKNLESISTNARLLYQHLKEILKVYKI